MSEVKKEFVEKMRDYILSEGHESESYVQYCKDSGDNPIHLELNTDHIFACAVLSFEDAESINNYRDEMLDHCDMGDLYEYMVNTNHLRYIDDLRDLVELHREGVSAGDYSEDDIKKFIAFIKQNSN